MTGASGAESRLEVGGALTRYVGRTAERAALEEHWSAARAGEARFVTVLGEAGIGKSRLVQEFRQQFADLDVDQLVMRSTPYSKDSAFLPIIELIELRLDLHRSLSPEARLDRIDQRLAQLGITRPDAGVLLAELLTIPSDGHYPPLEVTGAPPPPYPGGPDGDGSGTRIAEPTILVAETYLGTRVDAPGDRDARVLRAGLSVLGLFTARPESSHHGSG